MDDDEAFQGVGRVADPGLFDRLAGEIKGDPLMALLARQRRNDFINALKDRPDVAEVIPSGSLARETFLGPVRDVDLIVVFNQDAEWGVSGSARGALEHLQATVRATLQAGPGRPSALVRDMLLRNHLVRCIVDPTAGFFPAMIDGARAVDVMPAVPQGSHLLVPELSSDRWIDVDPAVLMRMVTARERAWSNFDEFVRIIKGWAEYQQLGMQRLAVEVLVLLYLPSQGLSETTPCSDAVVGFFEAASRGRIARLTDPAGRVGEIDPALNYLVLRKALDRSASLARRAVDAEKAWQERGNVPDVARHPSVFWHKIFGQDGFRRPRVWYWNLLFPAERPLPDSRRWFDELADLADESAWSWKPWHRESPRSQSDGPAGLGDGRGASSRDFVDLELVEAGDSPGERSHATLPAFVRFAQQDDAVAGQVHLKVIEEPLADRGKRRLTLRARIIGVAARTVASVVVSWLNAYHNDVTVRLTGGEGRIIEVSANRVRRMRADELLPLVAELAALLDGGTAEGAEGAPVMVDGGRPAEVAAALRHGTARADQGGNADAGLPADGSAGSVEAEGGAAGNQPSRYLTGALPERAAAGRRISLITQVTLAARPTSSALIGHFDVPLGGRDITVTVSAPGLVALGDLEQDLHVPAGRDSDPIRFGFMTGREGLHRVMVRAYAGGTFLTELALEISVEVGASMEEGLPQAAILDGLAAEPGEVTLQVSRTDDDHYSFQLIGEALYPVELTRRLAGDPAKVVQSLAEELRAMAGQDSPYASPALVRNRIRSLGAQLWADVVPEAIRRQFWQQADRIRLFTVASDMDTLPWELLYPIDGGNDNGFLVEQFPVVRRVYGQGRVRRLTLSRAVYVVPPGAPVNAMDEVEAVRTRLGAGIHHEVCSRLDTLIRLLDDAPSMLHFACHNTFTDTAGSVIGLDGGPLRPSDLAPARQARSMAAASPLVFLNACRTAGEVPSLMEMMGWAGQFMGAGAGAFIGSLWAVRSSSAKAFADAFYRALAAEDQPLGAASLQARQAIAEDGGDPTWLAYTIYGNPSATIR